MNRLTYSRIEKIKGLCDALEDSVAADLCYGLYLACKSRMRVAKAARKLEGK